MENEFKGTKGKWQSENVITHNGDFFKVKCEDWAICNITTRNQTFARANAQLISKAPCMLNMLNNYLSDLRNIVPKSEARDNRIEEVEQLIIDATNI